MVEFWKFHGLGNDFVIIEGPSNALTEEQVIAICRRHRGVGADGVLLVELQCRRPTPRIKLVVYNSDGSRPEMCGNGVRCVAAFAQQHWKVGREVVVESDAGDRRCVIEADTEKRWNVTVDMGEAKASASKDRFEVDGEEFQFVEVDVGNPHAVIFRSVSSEQVRRAGEVANDNHRLFPGGVNVEFVHPSEARGRFVASIYERGVGMTQACGTGACAVAEAVWESGRMERSQAVQIELPGGELIMESRDDRIWMKGSAEAVFCGVWHG